MASIIIVLAMAMAVAMVMSVSPINKCQVVSANIRTYFTNHLGRRYPGEEICVSSCGSCDGACCDTCRQVWITNGKRFYNEADAIAEANSYGMELLLLVGSVEEAEGFDLEFYLNNDNKLCLLGSNGMDEIICNPSSTLYEEKWLEACEAKERWTACPCVDKYEGGFANPCCKMGCNDKSCWVDTQTRGRVKRKWYM